MGIFYKYSGAGNDFVVVDGRSKTGGPELDRLRSESSVRRICSHAGTDGFMILSDSSEYDFRMEFFNPDGSSGMMCGNGGRCIVAFADRLGIRPAGGVSYVFEAPDGLHRGTILSKEGDSCLVRLGMSDAGDLRIMDDGVFVNTGTRHFVKFVPDTVDVDVDTQGRTLRWRQEFAPEGANVNFVNVTDGGLKVRTFEKGVEAETLACGTGVVASAVAAYSLGLFQGIGTADGKRHYHIFAQGGELDVEFLPSDPPTSVFLTGKADFMNIIPLL